MRTLIAAVAIAVLILLGLGAVGAAVSEAGTDQTITNESFTPDAASYVALNESNRDDVTYAIEDEITVRNSSGVVVDDSAYEWARTNGTINATAGGALDGEPNATITYGFAETTQTQRNFRSLFTNLFDAATVLVFVLGLAAVLGAVRVMA